MQFSHCFQSEPQTSSVLSLKKRTPSMTLARASESEELG
jgi:hypothetical protein